jgi:predicted dehydrogenase
MINMQINAGFIAQDHWVNDLKQGGGRIIGELCHFIDLFVFLCGSPILEIVSVSAGPVIDSRTQNVSVIVKSENGSVGTIQYHASGHASYPKERIEVHQMQKTAVIDNFRRTYFYGFKVSDLKTKQDKGQKNMLKKWLNMLQNGGLPPIPYEEIFNVSLATLAAVESLKSASWINIKHFKQTIE